jgi:molybdopterin converting factor small subunit
MGRIEVPLTKEARVNDLLRRIKEQYPELELNEEHVLATVNNRVCPWDQILEPHDKISFIPHIGGG